MSYIGQRPVVGRYIKLDQISSGFNGSNTSFSMAAGSQAVSPGTARNMLVSLGGVIQEPDTNFTVSGSTLTFTTAPVANTTFFAVIFGDMQSTGTPSDGTVLPASIASSGNFSFPQLTVTGTSSLGDDVTFTGANYNVVWDKSDNALEFADSAKALFGTGQDLQIYHDGTNSTIYNSTGLLNLQNDGDDINLYAADDITLFVQGSESAITCIGNGAVSLYYDNSKKFETTSSGATVTGSLTTDGFTSTTSGDAIFTGTTSGRNAKWDTSHDRLIFDDNAKAVFGSGADLQIYSDGSTVFYLGNDQRFRNLASDENFLTFAANGAVTAFYDGSKKFETTSTGATITSNGSQNGLTLVHGNGNTSAILRHVGTGDEGEFHLKDGGSTLLYLSGASGGDSNITTGGNFDLEHDSAKLRLGAGNDLQIYHDGTDSFIKNTTGNLIIGDTTGNVILQGKFGEDSLICKPDGAVELNFDNTKKFETTSTGATVTGNFIATGNLNVNDNGNINVGNSGDLQLFHNGTNSFIDSDTGNLVISSVADMRFNSADYKFMNAGDTETLARFIQNGAVELYYDNSKKFETKTGGVEVTNANGVADITVKSTGSNRADVRILATGTGSAHFFMDASNGDLSGADYAFITHHNTSLDLEIGNYANDVIIKNRNGSIGAGGLNTAIHCHENGAVDLYYDSNKKLETWSNGVKIYNAINIDNELNLQSFSDGVARTKYMDIGYAGYAMNFRRTNGSDGAHSVVMTMDNSLVISGDFNNTSDGKLKKNIASIADGAMAVIKKLRPVTFDWIDETRRDNVSGFIAQEVLTVLPNLVDGTEYDPTLNDEAKGTKGGIKSDGYSVNSVGITAHLTKALQEAIAKIEVLETEVAALKAA